MWIRHNFHPLSQRTESRFSYTGNMAEKQRFTSGPENAPFAPPPYSEILCIVASNNVWYSHMVYNMQSLKRLIKICIWIEKCLLYNANWKNHTAKHHILNFVFKHTHTTYTYAHNCLIFNIMYVLYFLPISIHIHALWVILIFFGFMYFLMFSILGCIM